MTSLSDDHLRTIRDVARDRQEGIHRVWSERECEALRAYDAAVQLECQRAGFKSLAEFEAVYRGAIRR